MARQNGSVISATRQNYVAAPDYAAGAFPGRWRGGDRPDAL